jgi:hypothetical protein
MPLFREPDRLNEFKNFNLVTKFGAIDLLGELPGVGPFEQIVKQTTVVNLGDFSCLVLDLDTLIQAKRVAGRDKDMPALRNLLAIKNEIVQSPDDDSASGTDPVEQRRNLL